MPVASAMESGSLAAAETARHRLMSDAQWAALFDQHLPLADRQHAVAALEHSSDLTDPHDLYMLGSLYHMGQRAPGSPVQQNAEKASLYLGNAAIRGSVLAMAKMAELKLAAGQYREAMNWAQIYAHYALLPSNDRQSRESYTAELVQRIMDHVDDSQMTAIMSDVNSFIANYDTRIRQGMAEGAMSDQLRPTSPRHRYKGASLDERAFEAGIADFIVTFRADGTAANVQIIDAVPRPEVAGMLREFAINSTVKPSTNSGLRYGWMPILMNDNRYRATTRH
ncbi:hypothetical protein GCM10027066_29150 [Dyella jejuensis]